MPTDFLGGFKWQCDRMADFIKKSFEESLDVNNIENDLYLEYNVKKGLRNANGTGVLVLLTKISEVYGYKMIDGKKTDDEGHLYYRGYDLFDLAKLCDEGFAYEKVCFLILFGKLPTEDENNSFRELLSSQYDLPAEFMENHILKNTSRSVMNQVQRALLSLYSYDQDPDNTSPLEILRKGISLMAKMPAIISYSLQAKTHYIDNDCLHIHHPKKEYSLAENILYMSRNDGIFTKLEAETLDLSLIIHADHGGGNNSTFTNVVISSSGTDLYSAMCGSLGALKGPRHGGANKAVQDMMNEIIEAIGVDATDDEINLIVNRIYDKDFYDRSGLVYGVGHAVYTLSDPRTKLLREKCRELSVMKGAQKLFSFYERLENIAIRELIKRKGPNFHCCTNVDYYSGLTYKLLNIPIDLYTPIFATARIVGWLAHNIENKLYCDKIIRPAAKFVGEIK